jgi:hypothetical protein
MSVVALSIHGKAGDLSGAGTSGFSCSTSGCDVRIEMENQQYGYAPTAK